MTFFRTVLQLVECPSACPGEGNAICAEQSITPDWIHLENGYFVDSIISSSSNRDAYSTLECLYVIPIVILFYFISLSSSREREKKKQPKFPVHGDQVWKFISDEKDKKKIEKKKNTLVYKNTEGNGAFFVSSFASRIVPGLKFSSNEKIKLWNE